MIRKHLYIFILCSIAILSSCENKRDNDSLAGFWQMVAWYDNSGNIKATKSDNIFYSVQLTLMKFHCLNDEYNDYYLSYFNHKGDSLIIYRPVKYVNDSIVSLTDLSRYGVPEDGGFKIEVLNSESLHLSSKETGKLIFRRY